MDVWTVDNYRRGQCPFQISRKDFGDSSKKNTGLNQKDLLNLVEQYVDSIPQEKFVPGETYITPAKQVAGGKEVRSLLEAALSLHFSEGKYAKQFDKEFRMWFDHQVRHVILCNSGS